MASPVKGASVQSNVLEVFKLAQIENFQQSLIFTLQIRRLDHITYVKDKELQAIGLSMTQIQNLRSLASDFRRGFRENTEPEHVYITNQNLEECSTHVPNKAIIPKTEIKLMEVIGEGTFSIVKRAIWHNPNGNKTDVAVKILRDVSESIMEDLQVEASHLLKLQHYNLVRLYGIVQQPAMMVFELCDGGELLSRLRDKKKPVPLVTTLLDYCVQLVKALTFLESKHYVHRDVAARNILLSKDEKVVKLCDFGLMRSLKENERTYVMHARNRVPFSWCPPEALRYRQFSHASDVWAFGVTAWEIFSYGEDPWIGCRAIDVLKRLDAGERLEKPRYCSQQIYDLIALCWNINPDLRPKFSMLRTLLLGAEFNVAEVRDAMQSEQGENMLQMISKDRIIVIENDGLIWYGQNERTRKFGNLLRSSIFVHSKSMTNCSQKDVCPSVGNDRISLPIRGSFIHAAHGDVFGQESWGTPEKIDEIYLKNPVVADSLDFAMNGVPMMTSSVTGISAPNLPISRAVCPPSSSSELRNLFKIDWEEDFDTASFDTHLSPQNVDNKEESEDGGDTSNLKRPKTGAKMSIKAQHNSIPFSNVMRELSAEISNRKGPDTVKIPSHGGTRVFLSKTGLTLIENDPFEVIPSVSLHFNPAESEASGQSDINSIKTGDCLIPIPITLTENKPSSSTGSISQQAQLHTVPFHRSKSNERPGLKAKSDREEQLPYSAFVAKKVTYKANTNENVKPVICSKNTKQKFNHRKQATSEIHRNLPATESNTSNKFSTKTKTRTIADCPFLDGNRRSRLESEISKALPPPSDLFFGKAETDRKHAINVPNDEIGSTTSFGAVVDVADVPSSSKLSLNGVLEPVRLLLNGQPSQQPLQSSQSATLQVGQDNSGMESLNANSTTSQPINDIQLPLLSLSNDDLPSNAPGYRFGMVLPNLPWNGTSTESTYDPCANSVLPPRLGPCTPFKMEEGKDLLEILDPLFEPSRAARGCVTSTSEQEGSITHAEQMKILYAEASFVDHSRCDQKVAKCKGNTAIALEELKIEYLVETEIASNRENAREALERNAWNLNAAANFLLNNA